MIKEVTQTTTTKTSIYQTYGCPNANPGANNNININNNNNPLSRSSSRNSQRIPSMEKFNQTMAKAEGFKDIKLSCKKNLMEKLRK